MHRLGMSCSTGVHRSHRLAVGTLAQLLTRTSSSRPLTHIPAFSRRIALWALNGTRSSAGDCQSSSLGRSRQWLRHGCSPGTPWRAWSTVGRTTELVGEEEEEEDGGAGAKEGPHVAVLLKEVVAQFAGRRVLSFVDCTLGAAGHASIVRISTLGLLYRILRLFCEENLSVALARALCKIFEFDMSRELWSGAWRKLECKALQVGECTRLSHGRSSLPIGA